MFSLLRNNLISLSVLCHRVRIALKLEWIGLLFRREEKARSDGCNIITMWSLELWFEWRPSLLPTGYFNPNISEVYSKSRLFPCRIGSHSLSSSFLFLALFFFMAYFVPCSSLVLPRHSIHSVSVSQIDLSYGMVSSRSPGNILFHFPKVNCPLTPCISLQFWISFCLLFVQAKEKFD